MKMMRGALGLAGIRVGGGAVKSFGAIFGDFYGKYVVRSGVEPGPSNLILLKADGQDVVLAQMSRTALGATTLRLWVDLPD